MTLEERIRRIEQYIGTSEPEVWVRLRDEIRASLGAPRAGAEPATAERTDEQAYNSGRLSVWHEIDAILAENGGLPGSKFATPASIRFLVAEVKRLRKQGIIITERLNAAIEKAQAETEKMREKYNALASRHSFLESERDEARAEVERIMGLLHDKAWMLAACLTIAEGGSARANEPTYLNSPAMDAVRDVVRERDSLRAERDAEQRRAMAAESERDVLREEHTARVLENSDLAHERDEAREERDSLRDQLAECQRVLALGGKVDAITKEKIARLERGVREAKVLLESVHMFFSSDDWKARFAWLKEFGS